MKKLSFIIMIVFILFIVSACENKSVSPKITEEEAESIVMERHSGGMGEVIIKSVSHSSGEYIVEWEIDADCEFGTDYVDDQSGEIEKAEETNC
ncbi:hypothetical protein [Virgibacillus salinus]|uniref:Peptidase propeptide and YPEB domain-containing protein n=1 Tax=Virgibacillus salinus TaxID=553311 RepID=A0A1H0XU98_9BACI|nr:hypothetical protein [Virgibacillus salinus]SDQ06460.1 hypothetical protein SAMN05216231_0210 [Virgibacillus salinus]